MRWLWLVHDRKLDELYRLLSVLSWDVSLLHGQIEPTRGLGLILLFGTHTCGSA